MSKYVRKSGKKKGLPPGSIVYIGRERKEPTLIRMFSYDESNILEDRFPTIKEAVKKIESDKVNWLNIDGLQNTEIITEIGHHFSIHTMALEDIVNTDQRPKIEVFDNGVLIILKMLTFDEKRTSVDAEQISFYLAKNSLISFQERKGDVFEAVRERLRNGHGRVRKETSDYLLYLLLDIIIDNYYLVLENIGDEIEVLEESVLENPDRTTLEDIYRLRKEMMLVRKSILPLQQAMKTLQRMDINMLNTSTEVYFRDLFDHVSQVIDTVEIIRDATANLLELYLSMMSHRMNGIMKLLTIFAAIFIPLTFIAGIYGMNFEFMPELHFKYAYPIWWVLIVIIALLMMRIFKKNKWL